MRADPMIPFQRFTLVAHHVMVTYADTRVLNDLSCAFYSGTLVGLSGPSGSGKSSLLRILAGIQQADAGTITHHSLERATEVLSPIESVLVPQTIAILEHVSVLDNCRVIPLAQGRPVQVERIQDLLHQVDLACVANRPAHTLSGGQQQRMSWIRAALMGCSIICLDEPTAHLDAQTARLCIPFFRQLARQGALVIIASHDPDILTSCDQVYHLHQGKLYA